MNRCRFCGQPFSDANVYSSAGWFETTISGLCEVCFDTLAEMPQRDDEGEGEKDEQHDDPQPSS